MYIPAELGKREQHICTYRARKHTHTYARTHARTYFVCARAWSSQHTYVCNRVYKTRANVVKGKRSVLYRALFTARPFWAVHAESVNWRPRRDRPKKFRFSFFLWFLLSPIFFRLLLFPLLPTTFSEAYSRHTRYVHDYCPDSVYIHMYLLSEYVHIYIYACVCRYIYICICMYSDAKYRRKKRNVQKGPPVFFCLSLSFSFFFLFISIHTFIQNFFEKSGHGKSHDYIVSML